MKILFLTDNFPPEVNAPASRTYEHARRWVEQGAEVTVITCAPNFPNGKVYDGYRNRLRSVEMMEGIRVVRVVTYMTANKRFVRRTLDQLSFAATSFFAGLFEPADIIVATSPQLFTTFSGLGLATVKRKPWVFELRDLWPESLVAVGMARDSWLIRALERIEMGLYRKATAIVAVTPAFKHRLIERGIASSKISVVTNGADLAQWQPRAKDDRFLAQQGLTGKFVIGYLGTLGMAHGLEFIVKSARALPNVHFLFVGGGAEADKLTGIARDEQIQNVTFLPAVPKAEAVRILASVDAALVPLRRSETFKTVIPSKIFEAAAMQKPILLGVEGQALELVNAFGAGIGFEPENFDSFRDAVERLTQDSDCYERLQQGCSALAQAYSRDKLAKGMLNLLSVVTNSANEPSAAINVAATSTFNAAE